VIGVVSGEAPDLAGACDLLTVLLDRIAAIRADVLAAPAFVSDLIAVGAARPARGILKNCGRTGMTGSVVTALGRSVATSDVSGLSDHRLPS
jgi:hypothetical protein